MPLLKCTKCNKEFKTGFIKSNKAWGIIGIWWGWWWCVYPIWPWVISLIAECPYCEEKTKLKVIASRKNKIINILILGLILVVVILIIFLG